MLSRSDSSRCERQILSGESACPLPALRVRHELATRIAETQCDRRAEVGTANENSRELGGWAIITRQIRAGKQNLCRTSGFFIDRRSRVSVYTDASRHYARAQTKRHRNRVSASNSSRHVQLAPRNGGVPFDAATQTAKLSAGARLLGAPPFLNRAFDSRRAQKSQCIHWVRSHRIGRDGRCRRAVVTHQHLGGKRTRGLFWRRRPRDSGPT